MAWRTKQQQYTDQVAILDGIAAGESVSSLIARLGRTKTQVNTDLVSLKRNGYLRGDGRNNSLSVVKYPPSPVSKGNVPNALARRGDPARVNTPQPPHRNGNRPLPSPPPALHFADGIDKDARFLLRELADPTGIHMTALIPDHWLAKVIEPGYATRRNDELILTAKGRAVCGLPPVDEAAPSVPVRTDDQKALLDRARRLVSELSATLAQLELSQ